MNEDIMTLGYSTETFFIGWSSVAVIKPLNLCVGISWLKEIEFHLPDFFILRQSLIMK